MHTRNLSHGLPGADATPGVHTLRVAVLGAGSWGTALAAASQRAGLCTRLWSRRPDVALAIREQARNPRHLPGIALPRGLRAGQDMADILRDADVVLFAVPCAALRDVAALAAPHMPQPALALATSKGVEPGSGALMTEVLREQLPQRQAVGMLAGPSFADEVARGMPTHLTLGMRAPSSQATALLHRLAAAWTRAGIELAICEDAVGVQVAGVLKNVVAIACGMAVAQGLGENARAAIVGRGLEDMLQLTRALGGRAQTLLCSSGVGDLFLTASSKHSRNTRLGLQLGTPGARGAAADLEPAGGELAEGARASHALQVLEQRLGLHLRVPHAVRQVLAARQDAAGALRTLLAPRGAAPGADVVRAAQDAAQWCEPQVQQ